MPTEVVQGARVTVECNFRLAGVLTDPLAVVAIVRAPSGDVATYTYPADLFRDAGGVYRCEFVADTAGTWWTRFEGSGVVEAVNEQPVTVRQSAVL